MTSDGQVPRPPRWVRRAFWCVVALEWTAVAALCAVYVVGGVWAVRYLTCADTDTLYASGYSQQAWRGVRIGDAQSAVRVRLGEPLQHWEDANGALWSYSRHGTQTKDYLERKLRFDVQGRLVEKYEACYLD